MKKFLLSALVCAAALFSATPPVAAQATAGRPRVEKAVKTATEPKTGEKGQPTGKYLTTKDGQRLQVYRGSKGGLFVYRVSKKSGKEYKQYLTAEQKQLLNLK